MIELYISLVKFYPLIITVGAILHSSYKLSQPLKKIRLNWLAENSGWVDILTYLLITIYWNTPRVGFILLTAKWCSPRGANKLTTSTYLRFLWWWLLALIFDCRVLYLHLIYSVARKVWNERKVIPIEELRQFLIKYLNNRNGNILAFYWGKSCKDHIYLHHS